VGGGEVYVLVAGPAGAGVFASSVIIGKALLRQGYHVFVTNEYPSLIRGGQQWALVVASPSRPVYSHRRRVDVLVALDRGALLSNIGRLHERAVALCDAADATGDPRVIALPARDVVREEGGPPVAVNTVLVGVLFGMLGGDLETLKGVVRRQFRSREVAELNARLAERGFRLGLQLQGKAPARLAPRGGGGDELLLDGNSALALGLLAGGLTFFAAYPMTPASPILHFLAEVQRDLGIIVFQPESELAAINMAIGAAYAGARAAVATSGGGFSLMVEALGQAAMTETPIVVVNVQRPGPSTGMPTHTAQGDLRFVIHASQGEFPRIVLAPSNPREAYELGCRAMNLAWKYQVPVIVLMDKFLAESYWSTEALPPLRPEEGSVWRGEGGEPYARYRITETGVSPIAFPGTPGVLVYANTSEHDEYGFGTIDPKTVRAMQEKRFRKLFAIQREAESEGVKTYGDGAIAVATWGSTTMVVREALRELEGVKLVQVVWLEPFPRESFAREVGARRLLIVENNMRGQLASLVREHVLREPEGFLGRYDGRPLDPEEVVEFVKGFAARG
jgi:2-oxoglutarate ferredoxin oxidoreductase subunit alpha